MGQSFALPLPVTSKYVERFGNRHFRGAAVSMQGWRKDMEDSHITDCNDSYGLFGVLDGHAGATCSAQCSRLLRQRIAKVTLPLSDEALQQLVLDVDAEFLQSNEGEDSGSTAVFGLVQPQEGGYSVQVCNVGDSRILVHTAGGPRAMTEDHKPANPAEEARIVAAGGFVRDNRVNGDLAVSRALGDRPYKVKRAAAPAAEALKGKKRRRPQQPAVGEAVAGASPQELQVVAVPEVRRVTLQPGDWLLAACDGIFEPESFTNEAVMGFVTERLGRGEDLGEVLCALCAEALKRGSTDNMTALLVQFADGAAFARPGELVPGPYDADMGPAKRSYFQFAQNTAKLSVGQTLERRFDLLQKRIEELRATPQATAPDFAAMTTPSLRQWLLTHGRPDCPKKRGPLLNACKAESKQHTFYEENDADRLQEELEWFKAGPGDLKGAERTAWFAALVKQEELEGDDAEDEAIALDSLSPEQLKALVEQGLAREMQEEIEEMQAEAEAGAKRAKKPKKGSANRADVKGGKAGLKKKKRKSGAAAGGAGTGGQETA